MMLVWVGPNKAAQPLNIAGALDRGDGNFIFTYDRQCRSADAVSLTMPVTLESYAHGVLHPVFQMNLPEGSLRETIQRRFRKAIAGFDDLHMLELIGASQLGRLRYANEPVKTDVPGQNLDDILRDVGTVDLLHHLLERFAGVSGVSGVQPKVLVRDERVDAADAALDRVTVREATHLVKTFDPVEFPELAANEYFCMQAAKRAGLATPALTLSDNGRFLLVERFDRRVNGSYLGFEDFCALNGFGTSEKYDSSYEKLAKRITDFVSEEHRLAALATYFKSLALSCALQNGDAHLKNFGVLYDDTDAPVVLSPTYDIVSTTPYIPADMLALTLNGSKRFPDGKRLTDFARMHCRLSANDASKILQEVADAIAETRHEVARHIVDRPAFAEVGTRLLACWERGAAHALKIPALQRKKISRPPSGTTALPK